MKIEIYHHNGQLAQFSLEHVTGFQIAPENGLEELTIAAAGINAQLAALLKNPDLGTYTTGSAATVTLTTAPPEQVPEAPVDPPVADSVEEPAAQSTDSETLSSDSQTEPAAEAQ